MENCLACFSLVGQLWPIYETLCQYRLMVSCENPTFFSLNRLGRLTEGLKEWLKPFTYTLDKLTRNREN